MLGRAVNYQGKKAIVMAERCFPETGTLLAIQFTDSNGQPYTLRNRPKGFKQYAYVKPESVDS
jgi:hypothetical protein